ncbi:hypothetical protein [Dyadobacter sp. BHUBP1]|uniref:hypothetical protein n=1 Tax=Dyadobacter sp. BHUBP1 TaxID=3424178 RepID=UPI003D355B13
MHNPYQIPEFPDGDQYWYLAWVGKVSQNQNDYLIEVDFVAIDYALYLQKPNSHASFVIKDQYGSFRKTAKVNVGLVGLLEIGSIWYKTKMVTAPSSNAGISKARIRISDAQKAQLSTIDREIDIPHKYYPYNLAKRHNQSPCVMIGSDSFANFSEERPVRKIIIPTSEVVRFFYSGSNSLLKQVFSGGIPRDEVYVHSKSRFDTETREAFIQIRKKMLDSDAEYIGRFVFCPIANTRVIQISQELQLAHQHAIDPFIKANLPLTGSAAISLCGKYVKSSEDTDQTGGEWAFLAYSIINVKADYPYTKLWFDRDNNTDQTQNALQYKDAQPNWQTSPELPAADVEISSTETANPQINSAHLSGQVRTKFLLSPPIEKVKKHQQKVKTLGKHFAMPQDVPRASVSENSGGHDGLTAHTQIESIQPSDGIDWEDLNELVEELTRMGLTCKYLTRTTHWQESDHPGRKVSFHQTAQMSKSVRNWCTIKEDVGGRLRSRSRLATFLKISSQNTAYYLIDCEARSNERFSRGLVYIPSRPILTDTHLNWITINLATVQGKWKHWRSPQNIYIHKQAFDHLGKDTPRKVAERLVAYIKRVESS